VVEGALFEVGEGGWAALDHKEAAPRIYRRLEVTVMSGSGRQVRAITYRVRRRARSRSGFVRPTSDYLDCVRHGLATYGLSGSLMEIAASGCRPRASREEPAAVERFGDPRLPHEPVLLHEAQGRRSGLTDSRGHAVRRVGLLDHAADGLLAEGNDR
jgi:AIG2-like family